MYFFSGNRASWTYCCIPCRKVSRAAIFGPNNRGESSFVCPLCSLPMQNMGTRWCPPKKKNHKAWRALANGNVLWDSSRVAKQGLRQHFQRAKLGKY